MIRLGKFGRRAPAPLLARLCVLLARPAPLDWQIQEAAALLRRLDADGQLEAARALLRCELGLWVHGLPLPWRPAAAELVRAASVQQLRRTMHAEAAARRVLAAIDAHRPGAVLLFKGSAVERLAYPRGVPRPTSDVDLLVRPGGGPAVAAVLGSLGATLHHRRSGADHWQCQDVAVDVHSAPIDPRRCPALGDPRAIEALFARAPATDPAAAGAADQGAILLLHLITGLGGDLRHLGDLLQWFRGSAAPAAEVAAILSDWQAAPAAAIAITAVRAHALGEPVPAADELAARLHASPWRIRAAHGAVNSARQFLDPGRPNPRWLELAVASVAWPRLSYRQILASYLAKPVRSAGQR